MRVGGWKGVRAGGWDVWRVGGRVGGWGSPEGGGGVDERKGHKFASLLQRLPHRGMTHETVIGRRGTMNVDVYVWDVLASLVSVFMFCCFPAFDWCLLRVLKIRFL